MTGSSIRKVFEHKNVLFEASMVRPTCFLGHVNHICYCPALVGSVDYGTLKQRCLRLIRG
jgi:hypothetical protein